MQDNTNPYHNNNRITKVILWLLIAVSVWSAYDRHTLHQENIKFNKLKRMRGQNQVSILKRIKPLLTKEDIDYITDEWKEAGYNETDLEGFLSK